jgi:hypothetical protein
MNFMARRVLHGMSKSRGTYPGSSPVRAFLSMPHRGQGETLA